MLTGPPPKFHGTRDILPPDPMEFWGDIYTKALAEENSIDFDSFSHADAWA